jgi:hypothetical protein
MSLTVAVEMWLLGPGSPGPINRYPDYASIIATISIDLGSTITI